MPLPRSHDALFRFVFGDPVVAADLLRTFLPPALAAAIDWSGLRLVPGHFVDARLRERQTDLLFLAPLGDGWVLLHVVFEHKAQDDRCTALQTTRYELRILSRWRADHPNDPLLPPVLPVVVHHGPRPMRAPRSLRGLVDVRGVSPRVGRLLHRFHAPVGFLLVDLAAMSAADLRSLSLTALTKLTLLFLQTLRDATPEESIAALLDWRELLTEALRAERGQEVVIALFSWLLSGIPEVGPEVWRVVDRIEDQQVKGTMRSMLDALLDEGRVEGRAEGRVEGRAEGRIEGHLEGWHSALRGLLQTRFGDLPPEVMQRLQTAGIPELAELQRRAITAANLDDVFPMA